MGNRHAVTDTRHLRSALGAFVTGVTVVTTIDADGRPRGLTANSFTSVSLSPPLILICIGDHAASFETFADTDRFAVNILAEDQQEVSGIFASRTANKFDQVSWRTEETGAPILDGLLGWLDCTVHERIVAGDHLVLIGRVRRYASEDGRPLGFFGGQYVKFGHEHDLIGRTAVQSAIGCLVEVSGRVLLCRNVQDNGWTIPTSRNAGNPKAGREAVRQLCATLGVQVSLSFIYSVFTAENDVLFIVYRGISPDEDLTELNPVSPATLFEIGEMPWGSISSRPVRAMLRRYLKERSAERFGIYVESDDGGQVAVLESGPQPFDVYSTSLQGRVAGT